MNPIFLQFDCKESEALDLRQADAVKKHTPDIIILEYPNNTDTPDWVFNKYAALEKPKDLVVKRTAEFSAEVLKIHPWAKADTIMWQNVANLWRQGHQVMVYSVDAPNELTSELREIWNHSYPCIKKNWIWWVHIYEREKIMAKHIQWVLDNYKVKDNPKVLVFLQSFHWEHVHFLLSKPSKDEEWDYYFGNFSEIDKESIENRIKEINPVFYKYWKIVNKYE